jgi:general secretion pathway protein A
LNPITPPLPAPTRTLSRLDEITGHAASDSAVGELLSVWGHNESLDNQGNACDQIIQLGLACFSATGDLQDLIRLDRPAALNLGDNTLPNWVTLISLTKSLDTTTPKDIAQLQFGSTLYWVDQAALLANGAKPFILLWQTPAAYQQSLTLGDSGASVDWLVNRLTQIESGRATLEVGYIFDLNLEQRVKAFQRSSGIEPDGVAGARTWILLNNSTTDVPRLSTGVKY